MVSQVSNRDFSGPIKLLRADLRCGTSMMMVEKKYCFGIVPNLAAKNRNNNTFARNTKSKIVLNLLPVATFRQGYELYNTEGQLECTDIYNITHSGPLKPGGHVQRPLTWLQLPWLIHLHFRSQFKP